MTLLKNIISKLNDILSNSTKVHKKRYFLEEVLKPELLQLQDLYELQTDADSSEIASLQQEIDDRTKYLEQLFKNNNSYASNIIMEIRPGTGGDEAAIFAMDLLKMYTKYCEKTNHTMEIIDMKGSREAIEFACIKIQGTECEKFFLYESGVHRVQRVPKTEAKGRIHTSTATVTILPESKENQIQINQKDLRIETCRASGAGGQHVNKTESAVRVVHLPTGVAVECQDERSQLDNRERAIKILKIRLQQRQAQEQQEQLDKNRKSQVSSADRSEKARTYNFKEDRITDHVRKYTTYSLSYILEEGNLGALTDKLQEIDATNYNVLESIDEALNVYI